MTVLKRASFKIIAQDVAEAKATLDDAINDIVSTVEIDAPVQEILENYPNGVDCLNLPELEDEYEDLWPECFKRLKEQADMRLFLDGCIGAQSLNFGVITFSEFAVLQIGDKCYTLNASYLPRFTSTPAEMWDWVNQKGEFTQWPEADLMQHVTEISKEDFDDFVADAEM